MALTTTFSHLTREKNFTNFLLSKVNFTEILSNMSNAPKVIHFLKLRFSNYAKIEKLKITEPKKSFQFLRAISGPKILGFGD